MAVAAPPGEKDVLLATGFEHATLHAGGANYHWYGLDVSSDTCERDPYGILANYEDPAVRAMVRQQLATMHGRGMRALSLGVFFYSGPTIGGTLINSSDPDSVQQVAANLAMLLADVRNAGFREVLFRFFPQARLDPADPRFDPETIDEYWSFIKNLRPVLAAQPLPYLIDLMVEGAPADDDFWCKNGFRCKPANAKWSDAVRELWRRYSGTFGTADTVGFSFLTAKDRARRRVRHMNYVYQGVFPDVFAFDFYGEVTPGDTEGDYFAIMSGLMDDYGARYGFERRPWIISEAFNNDPFAAAGLASAIAATGQEVRYLTAWPLDRAEPCAHVSEPPPYAFDIWRMYGF